MRFAVVFFYLPPGAGIPPCGRSARGEPIHGAFHQARFTQPSSSPMWVSVWVRHENNNKRQQYQCRFADGHSAEAAERPARLAGSAPPSDPASEPTATTRALGQRASH